MHVKIPFLGMRGSAERKRKRQSKACRRGQPNGFSDRLSGHGAPPFGVTAEAAPKRVIFQ
jgi:hypothetical protein